MSQPHISELDGVRGIAILLVLLWHYGQRLPLGSGTVLAYIEKLDGLSWSGVDLFFVLSGFLIGGGLLDSRDEPGYFSTFYRRRACRILPLYFVILAVVIGFAAIGITEAGCKVIPLGYYLTFTQNFWMVKNGWGLSLGQTWSLAVEEQFYLSLPFLIWIVPRRWLIAALLTLAGAAPIIRAALVSKFGASLETFDAVHLMLACRMDALLAGVLVALALRKDPSRQWLKQNTAQLYFAFFSLMGITALMLLRNDGIGTVPMMTFGYSVTAALYAAFLLIALRPGPIQTACRTPWLRAIGIRAYGIYLLHGIVLDFTLRAGGARPRLIDGYDWLVFALAIGLTFVMAWLSWQYLEKPIIASGRQTSSERTALLVSNPAN